MPRIFSNRSKRDVVELDSSSCGSYADTFDLVLCSLAVLFMLNGMTLAFADFMPRSGCYAFAVASFVSLAVHQAVGPRALHTRGTRAQLMVAIAVVAIAVVATLAFFTLSWGGLASLANGVIDRFNEIYGCYMPHRAGAVGSAAAAAVTLAVCGLLLGLVGSLLMQAGSRLALPLVAFSLMTLGRFFAIGSKTLAIVLACLGVLLYFATQSRMRLTLNSLALLSAVPILVIAGLFLACSAYQSSDSVTNARESFGEAVRTLRYGENNMPDGDVSASTSLSRGQDLRLSVTAEKRPENDLLLRGFVGCSWNGTSWEPISSQAYCGSWEGLMQWLQNKGFDTQTQAATYDSRYDGDETPTTTNKLDVTTAAAYRVFVYAPYSLLETNEGYELNHDAQAVSTGLLGARSYTETIVDVNPELLLTDDVNDLTKAAKDESDEANSFAASELVYRAFVHEQYTGESDEDRAAVSRLFFKKGWNEGDDPSLYTIVSRVRLVLSMHASYDANAVSAAGSTRAIEAASGSHDGNAVASTNESDAQFKKDNKSFVTTFLTQDHAGDSSCFASAAVLAFRSQDIPARYVEGYRLTKGRFTKDGESYTASATGGESHAWVEVYRDGVGWIPVEVTPGFYTELSQASSTVQVNRNVSGGTENEDDEELVTGGIEDGGEEEAEPAWRPTPAMLVAFGLSIVAILVGLAFVVLELQRKMRLGSLRQRQASENQQLKVRAYFDDIAYSLVASGIAFDKGRPEDYAEQVTETFPEVWTEEYLRMIELVRKSIFGSKELKPHEMKTLTSLAERFASNIAPCKLRQGFVNRYKYLR